MGCKPSSCCQSKVVYKRNYIPKSNVSVARKIADRDGDCDFFAQLRAGNKRDYILIVDRSDSMKGTSWLEAKTAVKQFSDSICELDPNGATVIFFDHKVVKSSNVKSGDQIEELFNENAPRGMSDLTTALDVAFKDHFNGVNGTSSILVITDGEPDDVETVAGILQKATDSVTSATELTVSILLVGNDLEAKKFLRKVDYHFTYKADVKIVDVVIPADANGLSFEGVVAKALTK